MKPKQPARKQLFPIATAVFIACVLVIFPFACRKADFGEKQANAAFDVAAAKEWWYGSFKKSGDFKRINQSSPIVQMMAAGANLSAPATSNTTNSASDAALGLQSRLPSWRKATYKTIGDLQVVEAPLIGGAVLAPIAEPTATKAEEVRLAALTQQKLLISTDKGGKPNVRVVTLVPSLRYAKAKNWDLGVLEAAALPADFEGDIIACNWAGTLLNAWRKEDGKQKVRLVPRQRQGSETTGALNEKGKVERSSMVCEQVYIIIGYHYYCIAAPQGDEPPDAACERDPSLWQQGNPIWDWVTVCLPVGSDGGPGDDICPPGLSMEECFCSLYNVGCEGGGGDGENEEQEVTCSQNVIDSLNQEFHQMLLNYGRSQSINDVIYDEVDLQNSINGGTQSYIYKDEPVYHTFAENSDSDWKLYANFHVKVTVHGNPKRANVEMSHINSGFIGTNIVVESTWRQVYGYCTVPVNNQRRSEGTHYVGGELKHYSRTDVEFNTGLCRIRFKPGSEVINWHATARPYTVYVK